jgi:hypothetical protein
MMTLGLMTCSLEVWGCVYVPTNRNIAARGCNDGGATAVSGRVISGSHRTEGLLLASRRRVRRMLRRYPSVQRRELQSKLCLLDGAACPHCARYRERS